MSPENERCRKNAIASFYWHAKYLGCNMSTKVPIVKVKILEKKYQFRQRESASRRKNESSKNIFQTYMHVMWDY